ncbi:MAG: VWA domain-containing protein [Ardenticatenales bacterium]|nr:VWA domain-containing protein [Ardenticatenales bacterium]
MSFLTPLFLLLGLLAGPIVLMYMLRLRRREITVSSTLLWQKLLRDREANAPWQKLRRNLLLILQLLILAALVVALARPFVPVPALISGSIVVLLDGSASMQATDVAPNRFAAAQEEVARLIGGLSGTDQMTIILVGRTPQVLTPATSDRAVLRTALAAARPEQGEADWAAAAALAIGAAQGFRDARIAVVSDGGLPRDLPPFPANTIYVAIGRQGENLGISALATRAGATGVELFASVTNYGAAPQSALISLRLDDALYDSRRVTIDPDTAANLTWQLPNGTTTIAAQLSDNAADAFPPDDVAWAVHQGGAGSRTLLVTAGNLFLEQIYAVLPGINAFKTGPDTDLAANVEEPFDLMVYDGVTPPTPLPDADLLLLNPPAGIPDLFTVTNPFSNTTAIRVADNPLLQFVDWTNVHIREARQVSAPGLQTLVEGEGGPLILIGERGARRVALLTFDLRDSDLPLQVAFPILMANLTDWLTPGQAFAAADALRPGDAVRLTPGTSATLVQVRKPDGSDWSATVDESDLLFTETAQPGLYQVMARDNAGDRNAGIFPINLFSPQESHIMPAATIDLGQKTATTAGDSDIGQRELWPWLAVVALLILIAEWWVHHRGPRWPQIHLPNRR